MPVDVLGKMKKEISLSIAQELGISPEEVYKVIEYPPKGRWEIWLYLSQLSM